MAKLDDFLGKKKETAPILDLSKTACNSKAEFRRLLEKVPDFKIKPEKAEPVKIKDKNFKFKSGKKDLKSLKEPYLFMNPLPVEMQELKIDDLAGVTIDWKMLTTLRPKNKAEENYFSRLVELGKLQNKSRAAEKRQFQMDPQIRKSKNKAGVVEMRVVSCLECGEDFCNEYELRKDFTHELAPYPPPPSLFDEQGMMRKSSKFVMRKSRKSTYDLFDPVDTPPNIGSGFFVIDGKVCSKFGYDSFARQTEVPKTAQKIVSPDSGEKGRKKLIKRKSRSKSRSKGMKQQGPAKSKSKSPRKKSPLKTKGK